MIMERFYVSGKFLLFVARFILLVFLLARFYFLEFPYGREKKNVRKLKVEKIGNHERYKRTKHWTESK